MSSFQVHVTAFSGDIRGTSATSLYSLFRRNVKQNRGARSCFNAEVFFTLGTTAREMEGAPEGASLPIDGRLKRRFPMCKDGSKANPAKAHSPKSGPRHGPRSASNFAATASTTSSSHGRPTICTPIGIPSDEYPIGTTTAGNPSRLNHSQ